tara:strand:- start:358 stop:978 length:621 start_codon:yes stop_codon:yes gene_type:complete
MFNNKAAMFGLDARIALAIFGALSVISGAALYSAIQQSKTTAMYVSMQELGKAFEQLYLDTGSLRAYSATASACFNAEDLLTDNSVNGWSGPYFSASSTSSDGNGAPCLKINGLTGALSELDIIRIRHLKNRDWDFSGGSWWTDQICNGTDNCNLSVTATTSNRSYINQFKAIDEQFDNSNSETGNIAYYDNGSAAYFFMKSFNYN